MTDPEALRAAFEKWAQTVFPGSSKECDANVYVNCFVQTAWESWQAAYTQGAAEARADENEACAKLADYDMNDPFRNVPKAIRARQEQAKGYFEANFEAVASPAMSAELPQPDGYAYQYHDCIRFNHGQQVNGSSPLKSIPFYYEATMQAFAAALTAEKDAVIERLTRELEVHRIAHAQARAALESITPESTEKEQ